LGGTYGAQVQEYSRNGGNTPVVINRLAPAGVNLFVKIEAFNPTPGFQMPA
jgi:cysteine synthase A